MLSMPDSPGSRWSPGAFAVREGKTTAFSASRRKSVSGSHAVSHADTAFPVYTGFYKAARTAMSRHGLWTADFSRGLTRRPQGDRVVPVHCASQASLTFNREPQLGESPYWTLPRNGPGNSRIPIRKSNRGLWWQEAKIPDWGRSGFFVNKRSGHPHG